jgi:hypothetical protein
VKDYEVLWTPFHLGRQLRSTLFSDASDGLFQLVLTFQPGDQKLVLRQSENSDLGQKA